MGRQRLVFTAIFATSQLAQNAEWGDAGSFTFRKVLLVSIRKGIGGCLNQNEPTTNNQSNEGNVRMMIRN
jgi:hypothetical protein